VTLRAIEACVASLHPDRFADMQRDHKLSYWLTGLLAASTILIERKSRRSELALYTLPRAGDSLYEIMYQHKVWRQLGYWADQKTEH